MDGNKLTLLHILLAANDYFTYEHLAQRLQVSSRTIIRFMKDIEAYVKPFHIEIEVKRRKGIHLVGTQEDIQRVRDTLDNGHATSYTSQERMILIMIELFRGVEHTKLYYLSYTLNVSLPTIHNDVSAIEEYLALNHLTIDNQRGMGIKMKGSRRDYIWAIASFLLPYIEFYENDVVYFSSLHVSVKTKMHTFFSLEYVKDTKAKIDEFDYTLASDFVLEDYHHFIILNTILIHYPSYYNNYLDEGYQDVVLHSIVHQRYLQFCKKINQGMQQDKRIEKAGNLYVSAYLAMRKVGTQQDSYQYDEELHHLVLRFLCDVEQELHRTLNKDNNLIDRLTLHMKLVIQRIRMGTVISNSYLDEVKKKYEEVFGIVRNHLYLIENRYAVSINENEIGYISIHVLATMIEQDNSTRSIKAAILCMSGMGTSKMLIETIRQRYPLLSIGCSLSLEEFNEFALMQDGCHLIISTIKLETITLPCAVVHPVMNEQDFYTVHTLYESLLRQHHLESHREQKVKKTLQIGKTVSKNKQEVVARLMAFQRIIEQFASCEISCSSIDELINKICEKEISLEEQKEFKEQIYRREELGSTIINQLDFILIHCRLNEVMCLKLYKMKESFTYYIDGSEQKIRFALVMIAPKREAPYLLEMMSQISMAVAVDDAFQKIICEDGEDEIIRSITSRLTKLL